MASLHSTTTTEKQTDGTVRNDAHDALKAKELDNGTLTDQKAAQKKQMLIVHCIGLFCFYGGTLNNFNKGKATAINI